MAVHHITRDERNWLEKLASVLDEASDGDIIVTYNDNVAELARRALGRRMDGKHLRIMTEQVYEQIAE